MKPDNVNVQAGKSLPAMKSDEIPTDNLSPPLRSNADDQVESLKQAMANINLADLTRDELIDLRNRLLKFHEKLSQQKTEVLGRKSESISSD